jgi:phenylpropionate dioxygenase-like ring-hydroxylating dioxygenase large terminal subunit
MLTREQNDLLTLTGPQTPGGAMMRRYWQPVALSEELQPNRPIPVQLLGEKLVLYRTPSGTPALLGQFCPHRGVDLSYGRVENEGLRCLYHGWLFSPAGRCLDQPGEPAESTFKDKIEQPAYPCHEANGLILAYLGPGEPPLVPELDFLGADPAGVWATKRFHACNYLQANDVDPQHLSFLHRFFDQHAGNSANNAFYAADLAPGIDVEPTPFGLRVYSIRKHQEDSLYVRLTNFIMPNAQAFAGAPLVNPRNERLSDESGYWFHWHVPIDDVSHWKYIIAYRSDGPVDKEFQAQVFAPEVNGSGYRGVRTAENRYLQDRDEMLGASYSGMGRSFQDHDRFAAECQGPIYDRTQEHLGTTDRPVIAMRKMMLEAIEDVRAGRDPILVNRDPNNHPFEDFIIRSPILPKNAELRGFWKQPAGR